MAEWRAVLGWEGFYEVSDEGCVRRRSSGRALTPHSRNGYPAVSLRRPGHKQTAYVHRLVCEAWHGLAPSPKHEVAHGNGDRTDPRADNLRWATRLENIRDKAHHGTQPMGEKIWISKLTRDQAYLALTSACSNLQLGRLFGVHPSTIWAVRNGKTWKHLGEALRCQK